jgi:hypothetical protein
MLAALSVRCEGQIEDEPRTVHQPLFTARERRPEFTPGSVIWPGFIDGPVMIGNAIWLKFL